MKSRANRNAGHHPSYDKLGLSDEAIRKKKLRDKKYNATDSAKKYRAELNAANRKAQKSGKAKVGDGRDFGHTKSGKLVQVKQSTNRAANGQGKRSRYHTK